MIGPDNKLMKIEEVVDYVLKVKERFVSSPFIFAEFLKIMSEYRRNEITNEQVMQRILSIFNAHLDLLLGFNKFLPAGSSFTKMIPSVYNKPPMTQSTLKKAEVSNLFGDENKDRV
jgi:histone deacetylase complex regulatory component SIN3